MNKLISLNEAEKIISNLKLHNKLIVTTNGSFDILHSAHVHILEKSKSEGDVLIVLLNSDSSIKRNKGDKRPIVNQIERAHMLSALSCVDYVLIFDEDTPINYLKKIMPHKHIKGGSFDPERITEEKNLLESWNGEFKTFPLEDGFSTTKIINDILEKYK